MKRLAAALIAVAAWGATSQAEDEHALLGAGSQTCAEFIQLYQGDPQRIEGFFFSWAQGFLSAMSLFNPDMLNADDMTRMPVEQQMSHIRTFCIQRASTTYRAAVIDLFTEIKAR